MAVKALTRRSKALTLVPLAVLSAAWTASIVTVGTSATAAGPVADHNLPDGTAVPDKAIEAPASVPVPGAIAPAVPNGASDSVIASASTNGIPSAALSAYQRGAQIMDAADASCHIPWELIAAIGRVESNHGQYGGSRLTPEGVAKPGIYGPELNGKNGTQAIADTDGGQLDKDPVYDRAVGPMQFIPSTWSVVKVDADGDGNRNPQDIDDAALATAVYLCSGSEDLATRPGQEAAVYRYNHSHSYVNLVLRLMEAYSQGDYTAVPSGTYGGTLFTPSYTTAINHQQFANQAAANQGKGSARPGKHSGSAGSTGTPGTTTGTPGSSTDGVTTGGGTGTPGDTGSLPGTDNTPGTSGGSSVLDPITKPLTDAVGGVTGAVKPQPSAPSSPAPSPDPVQQTVTTLSASAAATLCSEQMKPLGTALQPITQGMIDKCAAAETGKTAEEAKSDIPNTLTGLLAWLLKL